MIGLPYFDYDSKHKMLGHEIINGIIIFGLDFEITKIKLNFMSLKCITNSSKNNCIHLNRKLNN